MYGIKIALASYLRVWREAARRTGRTSKMLDGMESGQVVIVPPGENYRRYIQNMAQDKGLCITVVSLSPSDPEAQNLRAMGGKYVFDHKFVEEFYECEIDRAERRLNALADYLNREETPIESLGKVQLDKFGI